MNALLARLRWSIPLGAILALVLGGSLFTLQQAFAAPSAVQLNKLSSDPYTNSSSQHKTEVEPDTYSFGATIVTAFQAGRFSSGGGGSSNIGWATSSDQGNTWQHGFLAGTTVYAGGTYDRVSDPAVAYDAAHQVWLISSLGISNTHGNDVLVSRSINGGLTWSKPVVVAAGGSNDSFDKEWIVCDETASSPFYGHCYVEWDNTNLNGRILMSTSSNGGSAWGSPQSPQKQSFSALGGQPLVQPGGTVIVPIYGTDLSTNIDHIYAYTSTNGGTSWNNPVVVSIVTFHVQQATYRGGSLPSAEIDQAGKVYVVWADCRFETNCSAGDIVMSTSTDGVNWAAVQRIPIDAVGSGVDHFTAGIAVDKNTSGSQAHLALAFYYFANTNCTNSTCKLYAGFVSSVNGGASWSPNVPLAGPMKLAWLANTTSGYMIGDYISSSIVGSQAFPGIPVAFVPQKGKLQEFMYTAAMNVVGGSIKVGRERVVVMAGVQKRKRVILTAN
ncbi:MAG TPA: exo-alpha-sialidase [Ktedonobacter sp.]|nr:exo-alpha-sialidase [Ktedonobacter sp.]